MAFEDSPGTDSVRSKSGKHGRKSVRLDRPGPPEDGPSPKPDAPPNAEARPGRGGLLDRILQSIRAGRSVPERRESDRRPAVDAKVWVGWWDGDDFGVVEGRVMDLSRGGALLWMDTRPPLRTPVWFYKETDDILATVRGEVVRRGVGRDGGFSVRCRFVVPCPTLFFQAVLCDQPPRSPSAKARIVPPAGHQEGP